MSLEEPIGRLTRMDAPCAKPLAAHGALLGLSLELEPCKVRLRGSVAWSRVEQQPGRESGMGLQLYSPPPIYRQYVRALA